MLCIQLRNKPIRLGAYYLARNFENSAQKMVMSFFWNSNRKLRTTVLGSPPIPVNGLFLTIYQFLGFRAAEIHTSLDFYQMVGTLHSSWVITICSGLDFRSIRVPGFTIL